ncbi:sensor histidine kinase [Silvibacterium acidisoli]|uniref:sensor histidine kinase n=1 Tax=Acidobacteriaceae bacterium ZG23-2 TaxID=2883246 RepID=UPI00406C6A54
MKFLRPTSLRSRLTLWYVSILAVLLFVYAALVFVFQYGVLSRQLLHDEVQDIVTVEGLLHFANDGTLRLSQDYFSRPQSHLLVDRLMEVRDLDGNVLYRSPTLKGMPLGGVNRRHEGDTGFDERIVQLEDGTHVFLVSHMHSLQGKALLIRLGYSLAPLRARMMQFLLLLLVAIPLALLLAGVAGQLIARSALRPLENMTQLAAGLTANRLSGRLEILNPEDELGLMAKVFNQLLDRLEQAFQQLQRFTADAAHELRAPLAALRAVGEVALERNAGEDACRRALGDILEETQRLSETIDSLLLLARAEATQNSSETETFQVTVLSDEVVDLLSVVLEEKKITVLRIVELTQRSLVQANRKLLRVAILNVLHNALKFSPDNSILRIGYEYVEGTSPKLRVTIHDSGPGLQKGEHEKVFDRFYTGPDSSASPHRGMGLGLSIAKLIVTRDGGAIWFDTAVERGAKCVIELPPADIKPQIGV